MGHRPPDRGGVRRLPEEGVGERETPQCAEARGGEIHVPEDRRQHPCGFRNATGSGKHGEGRPQKRQSHAAGLLRP